MDVEPWKILASQSRFAAPPWLEVQQQQIELPNGVVVDDYYVIQLRDWSIIVALTDEGLVVTERHYKHALRVSTLCFPAGYLNDGEDPLDGAGRELREETGYVSAAWRSLGSFALDGNRGCGVGHIFLARDCRLTVEPNSGDLEEIRVELLPFSAVLDELLAASHAGKIQEIGTIAAVCLARLALDRGG